MKIKRFLKIFAATVLSVVVLTQTTNALTLLNGNGDVVKSNDTDSPFNVVSFIIPVGYRFTIAQNINKFSDKDNTNDDNTTCTLNSSNIHKYTYSVYDFSNKEFDGYSYIHTYKACVKKGDNYYAYAKPYIQRNYKNLKSPLQLTYQIDPYNSAQNKNLNEDYKLSWPSASKIKSDTLAKYMKDEWLGKNKNKIFKLIKANGAKTRVDSWGNDFQSLDNNDGILIEPIWLIKIKNPDTKKYGNSDQLACALTTTELGLLHYEDIGNKALHKGHLKSNGESDGHIKDNIQNIARYVSGSCLNRFYAGDEKKYKKLQENVGLDSETFLKALWSNGCHAWPKYDYYSDFKKSDTKNPKGSETTSGIITKGYGIGFFSVGDHGGHEDATTKKSTIYLRFSTKPVKKSGSSYAMLTDWKYSPNNSKGYKAKNSGQEIVDEDNDYIERKITFVNTYDQGGTLQGQQIKNSNDTINLPNVKTLYNTKDYYVSINSEEYCVKNKNGSWKTFNQDNDISKSKILSDLGYSSGSYPTKDVVYWLHPNVRQTTVTVAYKLLTDGLEKKNWSVEEGTDYSIKTSDNEKYIYKGNNKLSKVFNALDADSNGLHNMTNQAIGLKAPDYYHFYKYNGKYCWRRKGVYIDQDAKHSGKSLLNATGDTDKYTKLKTGDVAIDVECIPEANTANVTLKYESNSGNPALKSGYSWNDNKIVKDDQGGYFQKGLTHNDKVELFYLNSNTGNSPFSSSSGLDLESSKQHFLLNDEKQINSTSSTGSTAIQDVIIGTDLAEKFKTSNITVSLKIDASSAGAIYVQYNFNLPDNNSEYYRDLFEEKKGWHIDKNGLLTDSHGNVVKHKTTYEKNTQLSGVKFKISDLSTFNYDEVADELTIVEGLYKDKDGSLKIQNKDNITVGMVENDSSYKYNENTHTLTVYLKWTEIEQRYTIENISVVDSKGLFADNKLLFESKGPYYYMVRVSRSIAKSAESVTLTTCVFRDSSVALSQANSADNKPYRSGEYSIVVNFPKGETEATVVFATSEIYQYDKNGKYSINTIEDCPLNIEDIFSNGINNNRDDYKFEGQYNECNLFSIEAQLSNPSVSAVSMPGEYHQDYYYFPTPPSITVKGRVYNDDSQTNLIREVDGGRLIVYSGEFVDAVPVIKAESKISAYFDPPGSGDIEKVDSGFEFVQKGRYTAQYINPSKTYINTWVSGESNFYGYLERTFDSSKYFGAPYTFSSRNYYGMVTGELNNLKIDVAKINLNSNIVLQGTKGNGKWDNLSQDENYETNDVLDLKPDNNGLSYGLYRVVNTFSLTVPINYTESESSMDPSIPFSCELPCDAYGVVTLSGDEDSEIVFYNYLENYRLKKSAEVDENFVNYSKIEDSVDINKEGLNLEEDVLYTYTKTITSDVFEIDPYLFNKVSLNSSILLDGVNLSHYTVNKLNKNGEPASINQDGSWEDVDYNKTMINFEAASDSQADNIRSREVDILAPVTDIVPQFKKCYYYRPGTDVVTAFKIKNNSEGDYRGTHGVSGEDILSLEGYLPQTDDTIKDINLETVFNCPSGEESLVWFKWHVPENVEVGDVVYKLKLKLNGTHIGTMRVKFTDKQMGSTPDTTYTISKNKGYDENAVFDPNSLLYAPIDLNQAVNNVKSTKYSSETDFSNIQYGDSGILDWRVKYYNGSSDKYLELIYRLSYNTNSKIVNELGKSQAATSSGYGFSCDYKPEISLSVYTETAGGEYVKVDQSFYDSSVYESIWNDDNFKYYMGSLNNSYSGIQNAYCLFPEFNYRTDSYEDIAESESIESGKLYEGNSGFNEYDSDYDPINEGAKLASYQTLYWDENSENFRLGKNVSNLKRVHYIPIWYPDKEYKVKFVSDEFWTPLGMVSIVTDSNELQVKDTLIDDWNFASQSYGIDENEFESIS